ncbi:hypothetical protein AORI_3984 [Amycolatopsis keratiniphila]|uniref:Uncharacterized protein n=1 Tax=Amycolatopsis keratiniphila TaxID=129921 RepID=R4ST50_9PSEU|nr:hypothetical protein AORI_3984 [Amycolatopsis keratiniphila]
MPHVGFFGKAGEHAPEPLVADRAGWTGHPRVPGQVRAVQRRLGPRQGMGRGHDDVAEVGVHQAPRQRGGQRHRQAVGVMQEREVGGPGLDRMQSLVGVLLSDVQPEVGVAGQEPGMDRGEQAADTGRERGHPQDPARRALRDRLSGLGTPFERLEHLQRGVDDGLARRSQHDAAAGRSEHRHPDLTFQPLDLLRHRRRRETPARPPPAPTSPARPPTAVPAKPRPRS